MASSAPLMDTATLNMCLTGLLGIVGWLIKRDVDMTTKRQEKLENHANELSNKLHDAIVKMTSGHVEQKNLSEKLEEVSHALVENTKVIQLFSIKLTELSVRTEL